MRTFRQLLQMLKAGRVDMICGSENSILNETRRDPTPAVAWTPVLPVAEIEIHFAFSLSVADREVARFQAALASLEAERRAILARHGLSEPRAPARPGPSPAKGP